MLIKIKYINTRLFWILFIVSLIIPSIVLAINTPHNSDVIAVPISTPVTATSLDNAMLKLNVDLTIESKIRILAILNNVDEMVALNIACAESMFSATATNTSSTAGGVYQFIDGTWKHYGLKYWGTLKGRDKLNENDNIDLAMLVLSNVGTKDWNASKFSGVGKGWSNNPYEQGLCNSNF